VGDRPRVGVVQKGGVGEVDPDVVVEDGLELTGPGHGWPAPATVALAGTRGTTEERDEDYDDIEAVGRPEILQLP
jgi:hypothetical protein